MVEAKEVTLQYIPTHGMLADAMRKSPGPIKHGRDAISMGMDLL